MEETKIQVLLRLYREAAPVDYSDRDPRTITFDEVRRWAHCGRNLFAHGKIGREGVDFRGTPIEGSFAAIENNKRRIL